MKGIDSGIRKFIDQAVARRKAWLAQLKPGSSMITVVVHKTGTRLTGIYKCHSDSTITVESIRATLDHLFRNQPFVVSDPDTRTEDMTFCFIDIEMHNG